MTRRFAWMPLALAATAVPLSAASIALALESGNPALVGRRPEPQAVFVALDLAVLLAGVACLRRARFLGAAMVALALIPAALAGFADWRARDLRRAVLPLPPNRLRPAAAHVIAGFYDLAEARALAEAGVGGLFLSPRNVRGLDAATLAREIASLQASRAAARLPPLWIAADQEGGLVATLSPPLPRPAAPATLAKDPPAIEAAAREVGRQLAAIGVTVNFAPVVDVTRGGLDPRDRNSRIARRSFSGDPEVVTRDAEAYCRGLASAGVACTLKHFPGLGAITADTHVAAAHEATLEPIDLEPFRRLVARQPPTEAPWVMIGHVTVDALDPVRPASAAPALIGTLRGTLRDAGPVVTDDAAMAPYRVDLAAHCLGTLRGGGDFVLASWDPDVAYEVIAVIAAALPGDETLARTLADSDRRLAAAASLPPR